MPRSLRNKVIWITGASSGIGKALALALAREEATLVLSARKKEKLEEVRTTCLKHTSNCLVQPLDLSLPAQLEEIVKSVQEKTGGIDILINNAGQSQRSLAKETPMDIDRNIMELNFFSAVMLTKLVLPRMLEKQSGHIVVISSITGKFGFPLRTAYSAAKHALQGYFESLRAELKPDHVKVTIVSPGRIRTNISYHALTRNGQPYNKLDEGQASGMDPDVCASKIVKAIKKERKEILVGGKEIIMVYIRRFLPALYHRLVTKKKLKKTSMHKNICGIQQVGIGVKDAREAWKWYRQNFGMDINVFEDTATAKLMLPYTNGKECERYAALAMNMEGGGGFEIWQHTRMKPSPPVFDVKLGDTGIFITKMKSRNVEASYKQHKEMGVQILGSLTRNPAGQLHYLLTDPYHNIFEVVEDDYSYMKEKSPTGGVAGAVIGVSDIDKARKVYSDILEYDIVVSDASGQFDDLSPLPGSEEQYRRVLLKHKLRTGPFSKLLGPTQIELVQPLERKPDKIFRDRIWGELGFIHLCFDITGMQALQEECEKKGFSFTVNSADSFDMGTTAGHFSYISDPDGTPIEFVETHKLPIIEKLGWYMKLKNRDPQKPLPDWMVKTLVFSRIKD